MRKFFVALTATVFFTVASCGRTTTSPSETTTSEGQRSQAPAGTTASSQGTALVRFMNADATGKPRELLTMNGRLFGDVPYKSITPYTETPTDPTGFHLRETGGAEDLTVDHTDLLKGRHYTLVASPRPKGKSQLLILRDDLAQLAAGKAKVRVINATTDVNNLDLYAAGTAKKIEKGVDATESTSFMDVDPGTFEIRPARQVAAPRLSKLHIEANRFYTFVVVGKSGDLDVVVVADKLNEPPTEASAR